MLSIPPRTAPLRKALRSSRGNAPSAWFRDEVTRCATFVALSPRRIQRAAQPEMSASRMRSASTLGERKLLAVKRPIAIPMRSLLLATMAVCGIGIPNG